MSPVKRIQTVQMACLVVEAIARQQPVGVTEIARVAELDVSGVQRLLETLHEAGWIHPSSHKQTQWQLSTKLLELARHVPAIGLLEGAPALMEKLRDETNETVLLAALEGSDLVIVQLVESLQPVRMSSSSGTRYPLKGTAGGRTIIEHLPLEVAERLTGVSDRAELEAEIATVRKKGYAVIDQGLYEGVISVGSAVLDANGHPLGALLVAAPDFRADARSVQRWGKLVADTANELSAKPTSTTRRTSRA